MNLDIKFSNNHLPENNFYLWVNENWKKENNIPKEHGRWSIFDILQENNNLKIKKLLEETMSDEFIKCKILYEQGNNIVKRNKNKEIYEYLKDIDQCNTLENLLNLIIDYHILFYIDSPFIFKVDNDFSDSTINILHIYTGGLGLEDKSFYFLESKEYIRKEYKIFLKKYASCFNLLIDIDKYYNLEKELAKETYSNVEKRNPLIQNNPSNLKTILNKYPTFTFLPYLYKKLNKTPTKINLINPKFLNKLNIMFNYPLESWKEYFKMKLILSVNNYLSEEIEETYFNFHYKFLLGIVKIKSLWERSLNNVNNSLGFLLGKYYVEKYFDKDSKNLVLQMIKYIKDILEKRIKNLDWMSEKTKIKALEKLNVIKPKIGFPEKWREYNFEIKSEYSYLKSNILCNLNNFKYAFSKLDKKIDPTEWMMHPQVVNAYFSPSHNEIVFPAGILQEPFFSKKYDIALNFGGIGTIIGHEISHAFDDEGSKYDSKGNLNNWWQKEDFENYNLKKNILIEQFNNYTIENEKVNGKLTLGENIADLGGITISLESLKKYLSDNPSENIKHDNFSPIQRFFINYSRIWACNTTKEEIKNRILTDVHSPPEFRVNGNLQNIDDFNLAFAFNSKNKNKVKIW